jgi:DNA mismatch endonuclease (patch repair protein)
MRTVPSFRNLQASSQRASHTLSRNRSSDTTCERVLRSELWRLGLRFRKNVTSLPGKPDIVFRKDRVVVFCDGDFWHGRGWKSRKERLTKGFNASYWVSKIQRTIARDEEHVRQLESSGWIVVRVWETDILRDPPKVARQIHCALKSARIVNQVL